MAFFDKQLQAIKRHLGALETSQRVALGLCVLIIAGALLLLSQWSLQREMVPLYADAMSEEERGSTVRQLQMMGEKFEDRADAIYVRPEDRRRLIMALVDRKSGPRRFSVTFEKLIQDQDHFASAAKTQWQQNIALQNELAMTIQSWPRIREASVSITPPESRGRSLNKPNKSKATVQVRMAPGEQLDGAVVESLARVVSGAVPALGPQDVSVVDIVAGRSYTVDDPEDQYGSKLYDLQKRREHELKSKIEDLLNYIPGVNAQVTVKLSEEIVKSINTELGEPALRRELKEETNTTNLAGAQEPGVSANTSANLVGSGSGHSSTQEKTENEFMPERGGTVTQTDKKPGTVLAAAASIGVPRSYFISALKSLKGADAEPTLEEVDGFIEQQRTEIEKQVKPILDADSEQDSTVVVTVFADAALAYLSNPQMTPDQAGTVLDFVAANGRQLGLAGLALLAMGMITLIVRKGGDAFSGTRESLEQMRRTGPLSELYVEDGPVGKAGSPDTFLIAQETDENSVRLHQVSQQVSDLINDDPEGAAQLVRRWIERES